MGARAGQASNKRSSRRSNVLMGSAIPGYHGRSAPSPFRWNEERGTTRRLTSCRIVKSSPANSPILARYSSWAQRTGANEPADSLPRTGGRHRHARYHHATTLEASKTCNQHHHCTNTPSSQSNHPFTKHHPTTAPLPPSPQQQHYTLHQSPPHIRSYHIASPHL